jgi:hypothetical protein
MTAARMRAVILATLLCGAGVVALVLVSDREDADLAWAVFGPIVVASFVGTGLYAWRRRPESRVRMLMVLLGFAWCVAALLEPAIAALAARAPVPWRSRGTTSACPRRRAPDVARAHDRTAAHTTEPRSRTRSVRGLVARPRRRP